MRLINGDRLIGLFTDARYSHDILRVSIYLDEKLLFTFDPHIGSEYIDVTKLSKRITECGMEFSNATMSHGEFIIWLTSKNMNGGMDRLYVEDIINTLKDKITLHVAMPKYNGGLRSIEINDKTINYEVYTLTVEKDSIYIVCYGNQAM